MGRHAELARLRERFRHAADGRGSFVGLTGPPGIGKTTLAQQLVGEVRGDGGTAVMVAATSPGFEPPLGLWHRALVTADAGGLGLIGAEVEPDFGYGAVLELFSRPDPKLLVLEDLHAADEASLTLLHRTVSVAATTSTLLLGTWRSSAVHPSPRGRSLLHALETGAEVLPLPPLDLAAVREAVEGLLDLSDPRAERWLDEVLPTLAEHSGGNPLLLRALVDDLDLSEGRRPSSVEVAGRSQHGGLNRVAHRWLSAIEPGTREVLLVAALLGDGAERDLVADVCQRAIADDVTAARGLGVLTETPRELLRFTHPTFAERLLDDADDRRELHERIGEALLRRGDPDDVVLADRHFGAAGDRVQADRRFDVACQAADAASLRGAPGVTAAALDRAVATGRAVDAVPLLLRASEAYHQAAKRVLAWERAGEAARLAEGGTAVDGTRVQSRPYELARAALLAARGRELSADSPVAIDLLRRAEGALPERDPVRAEALAALAGLERTLPVPAPAPRFARIRLQEQDPGEEVEQLAWDWLVRQEVAEPLIAAALEIARESGDHQLVARLGLAWRRVHAAPEQAHARAEVSARSLDVLTSGVDRAEALIAVLLDRLELGDRQGVDRALAELGSLAEGTGDPTLRWQRAQLGSMLAFARGELDAAATDAEVASRHAVTAFGEVGWLVTPVQRVLVMLERAEELETLAPVLEEDLATLRYPALLAGVAYVAVAYTGSEEAVALLPEQVDGLLADPDRVEAWLLTASYLAEAVIVARRPDLAARLVPALEPFAGQVAVEPAGIVTLGSVARPLAGLHALLGDDEAAADRYAQAHRIDRALGFARLDLLGRIERLGLRLECGIPGDDEHVEVRRELQAAAEQALADGWALTAHRAQTHLREAGPPELTERQRGVLARLAEGWTYGRIGAELGFSHSTIRHEAMRIYTALDADGRDEAIRRARDLGLLPDPR